MYDALFLFFVAAGGVVLQITHNSYHLRFELPGGAAANMPVASCLLTKALIQGPGDEKPKVKVIIHGGSSTSGGGAGGGDASMCSTPAHCTLLKLSHLLKGSSTCYAAPSGHAY